MAPPRFYVQRKGIAMSNHSKPDDEPQPIIIVADPELTAHQYAHRIAGHLQRELYQLLQSPVGMYACLALFGANQDVFLHVTGTCNTPEGEDYPSETVRAWVSTTEGKERIPPVGARFLDFTVSTGTWKPEVDELQELRDRKAQKSE